MTVTEDRDFVHFHLDKEEDERMFLRGLVRTSYAYASSRGELNTQLADPRHRMTDIEADEWIMAPRSYDDCVVETSNVMGRQCKTRVFRPSERHLVLDKTHFERFRRDLATVIRSVSHHSFREPPRDRHMTATAC